MFIRDIPSEHKKLIATRTLKTNKGQYDYYQIFLELGIKFLKNGGKLGYIIPDSLLALSHRSIARKYIYDTTKIKEIYYTGPKFDDPVVSNIIIILKKEVNKHKREENSIKIKLTDEQEKQIPQISIKRWDFKFLIHLNEMDGYHVMMETYICHQFFLFSFLNYLFLLFHFSNFVQFFV